MTPHAGSSSEGGAATTPAPVVIPDGARLLGTGPKVEPKPPIYKRWWLWTAVGVVAIGGAGLAAGLVESQRAPYPVINLGVTADGSK